MIKLSFEMDTVEDFVCLTDIMDALLQRRAKPGAAPPDSVACLLTPEGLIPDDEPAEQTSEAPAEPAEPTATVEDVRKALAGVPKESALEVLNKFGAKKVGDLKTDDYAAVVAAIKEL